MAEPPGDFDCAHCLRPTFTRNLIHTLLNRHRSVNLIGPPGSGKRRLLEDVRDCKPPDTLVLLADLRAYKQSYAGFLGDLWRQISQPNAKTPQELGKLVDKLEDGGHRVLLLLDNFDALLDNPDIDPKFGARFHDHLNSLKNHPRMALACVTVKPHDRSVVLVGGQPHGTSWLDLEKCALPDLSRPELRGEIDRRQPGLDADAAAMIVEAVHGRERACDLLDAILNRLANQEDAGLRLRKRLKKWVKQFDAAQGGVHTGGLYRGLRTLRAWWATAGLPSPKKLAAALGGSLSAFGRWLDRRTRDENKKP
jgi:hypothetical protein